MNVGRIAQVSSETFDDGSTLTIYNDGSRLTVDQNGQVVGLDGNVNNFSSAYRVARANYGYQGPINIGASQSSGVNQMSPEIAVPQGMDEATIQAINSIAPNAAQVIAENQSPGEPWYETAQKILTGLVMTNQQRQLMDLNIERARQGLPPIDINRYTGLGVNVGLSAGTQNLVLYLALGAGALILLNSLMKR